jgi:hypothetical protein
MATLDQAISITQDIVSQFNAHHILPNELTIIRFVSEVECLLDKHIQAYQYRSSFTADTNKHLFLQYAV